MLLMLSKKLPSETEGFQHQSWLSWKAGYLLTLSQNWNTTEAKKIDTPI
jgi:hypothetical protein